jgi:hypothetical protein
MPANDGVIAAYGNTLNTGSAAGGSMAGPLTVPSLNGGGTAPTVAGVTHIVSSAPVGHDLGGSFVLTSDATSATGKIASVTFGNTYAAAPVAVLVNVDNTTDSTHVTTVYVSSIAATGFQINVSSTLTVSKVFLVTYIVIAS